MPPAGARAVPAEAGRGGNLAGQHGGEGRLVHLDQQRRSGEPATEVGEVLPERGGECLGQLATGTVVGEHPVPARLLYRGRERPRPGHLHLERSGDALRLLLHGVEVLCEQRARPALVDAGRIREPPARGLQVGTEVGEQARACGR